MDALMDVCYGILKFTSMLATGLFGVLGLLTKFRDDETDKITKWGKVAIVGIVLSCSFSLILYTLEMLRAKQAAEDAKAKYETTTKKLDEISIAAQRTAELQSKNLGRSVVGNLTSVISPTMTNEVLSWDDSGNNRFILSGKGSWIHNPISPYNSALSNKMPIADDINHHPSPAGPAGVHSAPGINAIGIWKFSKNVEPAKEFIEFLFRKENFDAFIVASNAFNQPPLRDLADHPIWVKNPKFAMLPKEAEFAHARGWPAKPNDAVRRIENNYVLPDMVAKAIQGMPVKRVMEWGQEQVVQAVKGQLKASG